MGLCTGFSSLKQRDHLGKRDRERMVQRGVRDLAPAQELLIVQVSEREQQVDRLILAVLREDEFNNRCTGDVWIVGCGGVDGKGSLKVVAMELTRTVPDAQGVVLARG